MPIFLKFNDTQYPFTGITHTRRVVRAILLDENNNVVLHTIRRNDNFCNQTYFETPGGGVEDNESYKEGLKREIAEEVGCDIEIEKYLGQVIDFYNLIGRKNINHYYLCRVLKRGKKHFASSGDNLIIETKSYNIEEAYNLMSNQENTLVSYLVKQRELPFIKLVSDLFLNKSK